MAENPVGDVVTLQNFWSGGLAATGSRDDLINATAPIIGATAAMGDLVSACSDSVINRATFFVGNNIFATALLVEPGLTPASWYQTFVADNSAKGWKADDTIGPPRWRMLSDLNYYITGGFLGQPDPSGITSWVESSNVGAAGVMAVLSGDPDPYVRLEMIRLLGAVAYPADWQPEIAKGLQGLIETLPTAPMYQASVQAEDAVRSTLNVGAQTLLAQVGSQQAAIAQGRLKLAPVTFPDGSSGQVLPAPSKPWWRNLSVLGAGVVGIVGGSTIALRAARR